MRDGMVHAAPSASIPSAAQPLCATHAAARPRLPRMAADDELDWDDLRYFLRAAQAGTLAGAARAMGVDHSTIGRRLRALERALGAPLVVRAPDGLHLTPLGEACCRWWRRSSAPCSRCTAARRSSGARAAGDADRLHHAVHRATWRACARRIRS